MKIAPYTTLAITLAAILTTPANAQNNPADTLRGPSVPRDALESIGTSDMNGRFTPVEGRPELAAFIIVCDDPEDLAAARELGTERTFELAELLVDEIDTIREITDANAAGNTAQAQMLLAQIRKQFDPDLLRDPLRPALEALLNADQRARLDRILTDYWQRWVSANTPEDQMNKQGQPRNQATYQRIENRLNNQLFQQDIASAYEYSLRRYQTAMQAMYDAIEPTPEQRAWIRTRMIEHIKETRLKANDDQREALMLEIYSMLDDDRKIKLFGYMTRAALNRN
jgi:hypothetical protein